MLQEEKYPDKPHHVNYSSSDYSWDKDKPSTLYGAPYPVQVESEPYSAEPQVIYESEIKNQEKYPLANEHDSLAFMMFSESDKYAIKQDYMYNDSSVVDDKYPVKGDSSQYDSYHPTKGQSGTGSLSYNKYSEKGETELFLSPYEKNPFQGVGSSYEMKGTDKEYEDPYKPKPVSGQSEHYQSSYGKYPLLGHETPPAPFEKYPVKETPDSYHNEKYSEPNDKFHSAGYQKEGSVNGQLEEPYSSKLTTEETSAILTSEIHFPVQDKLQPPLLLPITDTIGYNKESHPTKGDLGTFVQESEQITSKGYFITTSSYDDKYSKGPVPLAPGKDVYSIKESSEGPYENEKYIASKLVIKGQSVSMKPAGFDQIVTDLFHNATNIKDELKDTYNVNTNIIHPKKAQRKVS